MRMFKSEKWMGMIIGVAAITALILMVLGLGIWFHHRTKPNIIVMSIDTLRADHLSCYGYSRKTSPNIDQFAKNSVLFENVMSPSPKTAPAHMSLFTGTTPTVHGVRNLGRDKTYKSLDKDIVTLPEILSEHNYITVGFHGGGNVAGILGFDRGFDLYSSDSISWSKVYDRSEKLDDIRKWIRSSKEEGRPLFLFLHHYLCHDPYIWGPGMFRRHFLEAPVEGLPLDAADIIVDEGYHVSSDSFWKNVDLSHPKHKDHMISLYDGGVYYSDYLFGEVIKVLKEEGFYDHSIIILLSDHGEEFYEHGDKLHWKLFIETLHVPMIIKFPYGKYGGIRINEPVGLFDLMPTLLQFLGIETDNFMQGISFHALLTKKGEYAPLIMSFGEKSVRFLKDGFVYSNQRSQQSSEWLFDQNLDPREQNSLAGQNPDILSKMRSLSEDIMEQQKALRQRWVGLQEGEKPVEMNEELLEQLRSLGYL